MSTHPRKLIRDAVVNLLAAQVAAVDGRVYKSRVTPMQRDEMPCICVMTGDEESELIMVDNRRLNRTVQVHVDIYDRDQDDPSDSMDSLAGDIEDAWEADPNLGGLLKLSWLAGTMPILDGEGEKVSGALRLLFMANYHTVPA